MSFNHRILFDEHHCGIYEVCYDERGVATRRSQEAVVEGDDYDDLLGELRNLLVALERYEPVHLEEFDRALRGEGTRFTAGGRWSEQERRQALERACCRLLGASRLVIHKDE